MDQIKYIDFEKGILIDANDSHYQLVFKHKKKYNVQSTDDDCSKCIRCRKYKPKELFTKQINENAKVFKACSLCRSHDLSYRSKKLNKKKLTYTEPIVD